MLDESLYTQRTFNDKLLLAFLIEDTTFMIGSTNARPRARKYILVPLISFTIPFRIILLERHGLRNEWRLRDILVIIWNSTFVE